MSSLSGDWGLEQRSEVGIQKEKRRQHGETVMKNREGGEKKWLSAEGGGGASLRQQWQPGSRIPTPYFVLSSLWTGKGSPQKTPHHDVCTGDQI